ncbi:universal stress protein [Marinomonas sp. 15G1-11]|uniref:Universal stress protein n=1 Tax=Marinomonas phaeophyticola TaxID=3004091 RepID=A0ABT4JPY6_9GAMM|nr:universal stress protein [Marinomonas sp. 15G1-11]MCZ2720447.1 universal stress protein [Marinomonas sp. 15G1-11]
MPYKKILLAADLTDGMNQVSDKAIQLCKDSGAELILIHVIESLNYAYGGDVPIDITDIQQQLHSDAQSKMEQLIQELDITPSDTCITQGGIEHEIHRLAEEKGADLIVVGSHGRHGLALLLGSTANGVLHGAPCDVLAVRVKTD